mmetsp:Transcript_1456/g.1757  ORF Transcript_1456/g.1757 Transcript_1456/m.1757 type:complete len:82 (-) Transcript_1456:58-303(-)
MNASYALKIDLITKGMSTWVSLVLAASRLFPLFIGCWDDHLDHYFCCDSVIVQVQMMRDIFRHTSFFHWGFQFVNYQKGAL